MVRTRRRLLADGRECDKEIGMQALVGNLTAPDRTIRGWVLVAFMLVALSSDEAMAQVSPRGKAGAVVNKPWPKKLTAPDGMADAPGPWNDPQDLSVWPNQRSRSNSDPWLVVNHDKIREMKPRAARLTFRTNILRSNSTSLPTRLSPRSPKAHATTATTTTSAGLSEVRDLQVCGPPGYRPPDRRFAARSPLRTRRGRPGST